jgi:hypothetical protein
VDEAHEHVFAPILTFFLGAATGALVMRRGRTAGQMVATLSGIVVAGYLLLLAGDLLALYLDYLSSRTWIATHLLSVDPLLLDAGALALALLHFAIAPSVIWAFLTFQNRALRKNLKRWSIGGDLSPWSS